MNIHPLYYICILVRLSLIYLVKYYDYNNIIQWILLIFGLGFFYQGIYSSNNEIQVAKVFWHDARFIHGILYLLAAYYLMKKDINMTIIVLFTDLFFSGTYRFIKDI